MPQWRLWWTVQRCRAWLDASFSSCRDYRNRKWENQPVKFEWWLTPSRDSHHPYQRLPRRKDFADLHRWHAGALEGIEQGGRIGAGNGEQPADGLRTKPARTHSNPCQFLILLAGLSPERAFLDHHKKYRHHNKDVNGRCDHAANNRSGDGLHHV
jgi:hypothetical protein